MAKEQSRSSSRQEDVKGNKDITRVLAVGAHPDDVEIGCGGTLAKHISRGDEVFVLIMTDGERGNHTLDMEECRCSLTVLGVLDKNIMFGGFKDGFLKDDQKTVDFIEKQLKRLDIRKVYTHDPNDRHQDHRNLSKAVSSAARRIGEIFLFQGPSTHLIFDPHYFIELGTSHLTKKVKALQCYKSQIAKGSFNLRFIKSLAVLHGSKHYTGYAEAFDINHLFKGGKDV